MRHGKTDFNLERRYAGLLDIPLNNQGIEDVKKASDLLKRVHFDIILTSNLIRAVQTAEIIRNKSDIKIINSPLCHERNYGQMQGLTEVEVENLKPRVKYIKIAGVYHSLNPRMGETFPNLRKRARLFKEEIFRNFLGSDILIISHGAFLQQFHGVLRKLSWTDALKHEISNLELTKFYFSGNMLIKDETEYIHSAEVSVF